MSGLAELLSSHYSVYTYDRRGRNESGDNQPYDVAREVEDIDAIIDQAGGSAVLFGASSGAALALEAAIALGSRVSKLAMYEAPYGHPGLHAGGRDSYKIGLTDLLRDGKRGDAAALFMTMVGTPADMVAGMRQSPMWPAFEAVAPTLAYDQACINDGNVPLERASRVEAQTLVLTGGASPEFFATTASMLCNAIARCEHQVVPDQRHDFDNAVVAPILAEFFGVPVRGSGSRPMRKPR
jgi:pimeloyl-ACP methyl ester carboxylesterase